MVKENYRDGKSFFFPINQKSYMSQVNLLEFQDYLLYSESLNILIESEFSSMSSDTTAFQAPPTKAPEASMDLGTIPQKISSKIVSKWISSSSSSKISQYMQKSLLKKQNIAPEPIKITKQQVPAKQIGTSEPSSPLSVASSHDNSCSDSSAASIFSDSKITIVCKCYSQMI